MMAKQTTKENELGLIFYQGRLESLWAVLN